ncbi:MAG: hypothetical protein IK094_07850 [Treponema sp.]|nr:hypothetical protein [Treponema sp.]
MKKLSLSVLLIAFGFFAFAFDDSPFMKPNGEPKSYLQTDFTITTKFGDYFRTPAVKYKHTFNADGLEIESAEYSVTGQLASKMLYEYTADKQLASQSCCDADGNLFWKVSAVFDKNGKKTEENEYDAKGALLGKTIYKYEGSDSIDETYYNSRGDLIWKNTYKYNSEQKLVENCSYFANGNLDVKKIYVYSPDGKLTEINSYNHLNEQIAREVNIYNADGLLSEYAVYGSDGKRRSRVFYKYDAKKNVIKQTTYNIAQKFGNTVNEMVGQSDFEYEYPNP